jgi:hypothetical protein
MHVAKARYEPYVTPLPSQKVVLARALAEEKAILDALERRRDALEHRVSVLAEMHPSYERLHEMTHELASLEAEIAVEQRILGELEEELAAERDHQVW